MRVHFEWGHAKTLITPKLKELQRAKFAVMLSLLLATSTQNFKRFRYTVMEKQSHTQSNRFKHIKVNFMYNYNIHLRAYYRVTVSAMPLL